MVTCQWSLVARGSFLPPGCVLSSIRSLQGCMLILWCLNLSISFHLSFQLKLFFMNSTLEDKLPGGKGCPLLFQAFPFCLDWMGCSFPSDDVCSFRSEAFLPPSPAPSLHSYMPLFLPLSYPVQELPWATLGKRICQVCKYFCCWRNNLLVTKPVM